MGERCSCKPYMMSTTKPYTLQPDSCQRWNGRTYIVDYYKRVSEDCNIDGDHERPAPAMVCTSKGRMATMWSVSKTREERAPVRRAAQDNTSGAPKKFLVETRVIQTCWPQEE